MAIVEQFTCLEDNFGVLLHDPATGATAAIDAPEAEPIKAALARRGWALSDVLVTHHHADHVQGLPALREAYPGLKVTAPRAEAARVRAVSPVDVEVAEGDVVRVGSLAARVIETPGHTAGHIVYFVAEPALLFAGDTLFALGCGRVLETAPTVMWESLCKLVALPRETQVYCGHEYTLANARFALGIEPGNALLADRAAQVETLRAQGRATLPTTLALEVATNPFLRADIPAVQEAVGMAGRDPAAVFAEVRARKNRA